ncbi:hypothetical protein ACUH93_07050 [Dermabacteraceae bacterium P7006]
MIQKLGPGSLKIGETGSPKEFASKCTKVVVKPSWKDGDNTNYLDGTTATAEGEADHTLEIEFDQEYTNDGLVKWTWDNRGQVQPFTYVPNSDTGEIKVTGKVRIMPVDIGGEVMKPNKASATWKIVGDPAIENKD